MNTGIMEYQNCNIHFYKQKKKEKENYSDCKWFDDSGSSNRVLMTPLLIFQINVFKFLGIQLLKLICLSFIFCSIIFCASKTLRLYFYLILIQLF